LSIPIFSFTFIPPAIKEILLPALSPVKSYIVAQHNIAGWRKKIIDIEEKQP